MIAEAGRGAGCGMSRGWPRRSGSADCGAGAGGACVWRTGGGGGGAGDAMGSAGRAVGGAWNQLCLHWAHLTCRPVAPTALSGTT